MSMRGPNVNKSAQSLTPRIAMAGSLRSKKKRQGDSRSSVSRQQDKLFFERVTKRQTRVAILAEGLCGKRGALTRRFRELPDPERLQYVGTYLHTHSDFDHEVVKHLDILIPPKLDSGLTDDQIIGGMEFEDDDVLGVWEKSFVATVIKRIREEHSSKASTKLTTEDGATRTGSDVDDTHTTSEGQNTQTVGELEDTGINIGTFPDGAGREGQSLWSQQDDLEWNYSVVDYGAYGGRSNR